MTIHSIFKNIVLSTYRSIDLKKKLIILCIFFAGIHTLNAQSSQATANQIMEKNKALKKPNLVRNSSVLVVFNGLNKEVKEFNVFGKKYGEQSRWRFIFTKPTKMGIIIWSQPEMATIQWLNLSGNIFTKVASSNMHSSFMGSHFYLEDLSDHYLDNDDYRYLGEEVVNNVDCYKIEAKKKKDVMNVYEKKIVYVRKSDYFIIKVDLYEKKGLTKILTFDKIEIIDGVITARKIIMSKSGVDDKSIVYLKEVEFNKPVDDSLFIP
ncbi:MAG: outer membrane lipoprotein-sorting protein [Spirochaetia bacterium]|nr:outer membrane lipoprotein-sorting protein [Spirochaetia bacterium]